MKHIAKTITFLGQIAGQKTAGTECGKRVPVAMLAIDSDSDCPTCRAAVEKTHQSHIDIIEYAKSIGVTYSQKDWDGIHGPVNYRSPHTSMAELLGGVIA